MARQISTWGALAGVALVAGIVVFDVVIPMAIAGQRVSGSTDPAAISAYFRHPELAGLVVLSFVSYLALVPFALALRLCLGSREPWLAGIGFALALVELPLVFVKASIGSALVTIVAAGGDPLPLFRLWDVLYNSGVYAIEAGLVVSFSLATAGVSGFPRWLPAAGIAIGGLQVVNLASLFVGLPDALTLPGNLGFVVWVLASATGLRAQRVGSPELAAVGLA
jgi:hypothetical protein